MASKKVNIRMPELPQIEVKIDGQWQQVSNLINGMSGNILKSYDKGIHRCSRAIIHIVRKAIKTGLPPMGTYWPPLSKTTIRTHGKHGIYKLKGFYSRSIGVKNYQNKTILGFPYNQQVTNASITINQLAIILEHGSKITPDGEGNGIPPRPLWAPSFKAYGGVGKLKVELLKEIRRGLISEFNLTANQIRQTK